MASPPELRPLKEVDRLSPTCIRILGGNPSKFTLQGTNTYLLGTGKERLLVDTGQGHPSWKSLLRETLERENATVQKVLLTHWHIDHTYGVPDVLDLCPDAVVFKNEPSEGQHGISDAQTFAVQGATLTAFHTPGHTVDHMVFVLAEENAMFTGDNILGHGTGVFEDLSTYISSLDRMKHLFKGRAYPGHGPVIDDGPARAAEYIAHRKQREAQVIQTLNSPKPGGTGSGAGWTVMEIVEVMYKDVPKELHVAASGGVIQILERLEKERKVSRDRDTYKWKL